MMDDRSRTVSNLNNYVNLDVKVYSGAHLHEVVRPLHLGHEVLHCLLPNHWVRGRRGGDLVHSNVWLWSQLERRLVLEGIHHLSTQKHVKGRLEYTEIQGAEKCLVSIKGCRETAVEHTWASTVHSSTWSFSVLLYVVSGMNCLFTNCNIRQDTKNVTQQAKKIDHLCYLLWCIYDMQYFQSSHLCGLHFNWLCEFFIR